jgi:hypothetical protein
MGSFQGSQSWGDVYSVVLFGALGWLMKQLNWPRPPLILGLVLGAIFERYFFISTQVYGSGWIARPIVMAVLAVAAWMIWGPLRDSVRDTVGSLTRLRLAMMRFDRSAAFTASLIIAVAVALWFTQDWPADAKLVPHTAAYAALFFATLNLATETFTAPHPETFRRARDLAATHRLPAHPDEAIATPVRRARAVRYFAWLVGFLLLGAGIGLLPATGCFVLLLMRFEFCEAWIGSIALSTATTLVLWGIFDRILAVPWPQSLIGDLMPALRHATGLV